MKKTNLAEKAILHILIILTVLLFVIPVYAAPLQNTIDSVSLNASIFTLEKEANEIIKHIDPNWSDFDKILYVHNWICEHVTYGYNEEDLANDPTNGEKYGKTYVPDVYETAYLPILFGKGVCANYAWAFQYLMDKLNIECDCVSGFNIKKKGDNHAWNIVKLDGKWYYVDCTWDDGGSSARQTIIYPYFLCSKAGFGHEDFDDWSFVVHYNNKDFFDDMASNDYEFDWRNKNSFSMFEKPYYGNKWLYKPSTDNKYYLYDKSTNTTTAVADTNTLGWNTDLQNYIDNNLKFPAYEDNNYDYGNYKPGDLYKSITIKKDDRIYVIFIDNYALRIKKDGDDDKNSFVITEIESSSYDDSWRHPLGINSYNDSKLGYISITEKCDISRDDVYSSPVVPEQETIDISDFINYHTVNFDLNGGNSDTIPPQKHLYGEKVTKPENDPERKSGTRDFRYVFSGWYRDPECTKTYSFNSPVTEDITIYAGWEKQTEWVINVIYETDGGTEITTYNTGLHGEVIKPEDPVKEGFTFVGWYTDPEFTTPFDFENEIVYTKITLYAKWEPKNSEGNENENSGNNGNEIPPEPTPAPNPSPDPSTKQPEKNNSNIQTFEASYNGYIATISMNKSVPFTKKKKEVVNNLDVSISVKDADGNQTGIFLKSVKATKPKNGSSKVTVVLKGSNKLENKTAKKLNKQLKKKIVAVDPE